MSNDFQKAVALVSAAFIAAVAGCSDRMPNTGPESKPNLSVEKQGPVDSHWTFDDERDRIAREEVPGFGGLIYDENQNPVVYLVDTEQRPAAERLIERVHAELGLSPGTLVVRKATYDFTQLKNWHDQLRPLFGREGVILLDVAESVNKVKVGVESAAATATVLAFVQAAGIPSDAVVVETTPRVVPRRALTDWSPRPIDAGYRIRNENNSKPCTLGFNAKRGSTKVFVTASHCSDSAYSAYADQSTEYQPDTSSAIGTESGDREPWLCAGLQQPECRLSDAARFTYDGSVAFEKGYIARTTDPRAQDERGGTTVDTTERLEIHGKASSYEHSEGRVVEKIGATTGWTIGQIMDACTLITMSGVRFECQMKADVFSWGGDSGAPFFVTTDSTSYQNEWVKLYGTLMGGPAGDSTESWYSPIDGIEEDLSATFDVDAPLPPPPLTVNIDGPTQVQPYDWCIWYADVEGGVSPYYYEWSGLFYGNRSYVTGSLWNSGYLRLDAHDSDSPYQDGSKQIYVEVTWDAPSCW